MGQFDKNQTQKPNAQKSKAVLAVTLTLALGGVVAFQMMKSAPRAASAANNSLLPDPLLPAMTTAPASVSDELSALAQDPTAPFLRGNHAQDTVVLAPPRDPFRMSEKLRASLTRDPGPVIVSGNNNTPDPHPVVILPQGADTTTLKITGIFRDKDKQTAIINGIMARTGMVIKNVRICEILEDRIIVQNASFPRPAQRAAPQNEAE